MKHSAMIVLFMIALFPWSVHSALSDQEKHEDGFFMVSGHLYDLGKEVGVKQSFLDKAIPFINSTNPDLLILTGDVVWAVPTSQVSRPVETIRAQYRYLTSAVFNKINAKIYCVAGNHDTGKTPHPHAVELFEEYLNPLSFSFVHEGSLFLFLSIYQPFPHMEMGGMLSRLPRLWENYDTAESRAFLDGLRKQVEGSYDHIFIFAHFSPLNDFAIGYYWTHFIIPLLTSLEQDVHVFSTPQLTRASLALDASQVFRTDNISFYCFANFPLGSYLVNYDTETVSVRFLKGSDFVQVPMKEINFQPATRLSMAKSYLYNWCYLVPKTMIKFYWSKCLTEIKSYLKRFR